MKLLTYQEIADKTGLSKSFFLRNAKKMGAINGKFNPKIVEMFLLHRSLELMEKSGAKERVISESRQIAEDILDEMGIGKNG